MKVVTISALRKNMKNYFNEISNSSEIIVVPRNEEENAIVILSIKQYNSILETQNIISNDPDKDQLMELVNKK